MLGFGLGNVRAKYRGGTALNPTYALDFLPVYIQMRLPVAGLRRVHSPHRQVLAAEERLGALVAANLFARFRYRITELYFK